MRKGQRKRSCGIVASSSHSQGPPHAEANERRGAAAEEEGRRALALVLAWRCASFTAGGHSGGPHRTCSTGVCGRDMVANLPVGREGADLGLPMPLSSPHPWWSAQGKALWTSAGIICAVCMGNVEVAVVVGFEYGTKLTKN
eukprot:RCo051926